jgi:hypothetical protein
MPAQQPNGVLEPREPPSLTAWKNSAKVLWLNHGKSQAGRASEAGTIRPGSERAKYVGLSPELQRVSR